MQTVSIEATPTSIERHKTIMSSCRPSVLAKVKVMFSHTRYRALGPELIPVYRQSTFRWLQSSPGGRLPLLSARPAVTFLVKERNRSSTSTKLYCLVIEAHRCEQLAQGCYAALPPAIIELTTYRSNALQLQNTSKFLGFHLGAKLGFDNLIRTWNSTFLKLVKYT